MPVVPHKLHRSTGKYIHMSTAWLTWHPILVHSVAGDMSVFRIAIAPIHRDGVALDARDMRVVYVPVRVSGLDSVANSTGAIRSCGPSRCCSDRGRICRFGCNEKQVNSSYGCARCQSLNECVMRYACEMQQNAAILYGQSYSMAAR